MKLLTTAKNLKIVNVVIFLTILRREMQDGFFLRRADVEQLGINEQTVVRFADSFSE